MGRKICIYIGGERERERERSKKAREREKNDNLNDESKRVIIQIRDIIERER